MDQWGLVTGHVTHRPRYLNKWRSSFAYMNINQFQSKNNYRGGKWSLFTDCCSWEAHEDGGRSVGRTIRGGRLFPLGDPGGFECCGGEQKEKKNFV